MPMLAFVLPVSTAVSVTTALTSMTSVHQISRHWRRVAWGHFTIMALYSAIGIGLGFYFINMLDEEALRRGLGVFLILYSLYALATAGNVARTSSRWRRALAACAGQVKVTGPDGKPAVAADLNATQLRNCTFAPENRVLSASERIAVRSLGQALGLPPIPSGQENDHLLTIVDRLRQTAEGAGGPSPAPSPPDIPGIDASGVRVATIFWPSWRRESMN